MDTITPEQRSKVMSRIRSKEMKPEVVVRRHLHVLGFRCCLHSSKLPGHPDVVLPNLCERLLLTSARGLQNGDNAEVKCGILAD